MSNAAKAQQEPTMEEILASIRRIIADDTGPTADATPAAPPAPVPAAKAKPKPVPTPAAPQPEATAENEEAGLNQDDIDAVFASMENNAPAAAETDDVLELTEDMSDWEAAAREEAQDKARAAEAEEKTAADDGPETPSDDASSEAPAIVEPPEVIFTESDPGETEVASAPLPEPVFTPARATAPPPPTPAAMMEALLSPTTDAAVSSSFGSLARTLLTQNPRTLEDLVADMMRPMLKDWLDQNLPTLVERMVRAEIERVSRGRN